MIDQQPAIQAALEQLQAACGFETGDSGTGKLIRTWSEALPLVDWEKTKGDPEGAVLDLLVEIIDTTAERFRSVPTYDDPYE